MSVNARVLFGLAAFFDPRVSDLPDFFEFCGVQRGFASTREENAQKDRYGGKQEEARVAEDPDGIPGRFFFFRRER